MSAKWRRNKKREEKFNLFKVFGKSKEKNVSRSFRIKTMRIKRTTNSFKYKVQKIPEGKLKEPPRLIDVLEGADEITVFAEFAGFNKESLRVNVKNQRLSLCAKASDRKYRKSINLPKRVIPGIINTRYKNGVLEIRLKKVLEQEAMDKLAG